MEQRRTVNKPRKEFESDAGLSLPISSAAPCLSRAARYNGRTVCMDAADADFKRRFAISSTKAKAGPRALNP